MQNFLSGNKDSLSKKASYLRFSAKTLVEKETLDDNEIRELLGFSLDEN